MLALSLIAIPLLAYIWILLRAADDERTGWEHDEHPTFALPHSQPAPRHFSTTQATGQRNPGPYNWGVDDSTYRWLLARDGWRTTLAEIEALPTTEEPVA